MSLKFSFGGAPGGASADHHDHHDAPSGATSLPLTPAPAGGPLTFALSLEPARVTGEARSGGVAYATAAKPVNGEDPAAVAVAIRSVLSRLEAELVEPMRGTAAAVELTADPALDLAAVLAGLGAEPSAPAVGDALQSRTGLAAGTPIRVL